MKLKSIKISPKLQQRSRIWRMCSRYDRKGSNSLVRQSTLCNPRDSVSNRRATNLFATVGDAERSTDIGSELKFCDVKVCQKQFRFRERDRHADSPAPVEALTRVYSVVC